LANVCFAKHLVTRYDILNDYGDDLKTASLFLCEAALLKEGSLLAVFSSKVILRLQLLCSLHQAARSEKVHDRGPCLLKFVKLNMG